MIEKFQPDKIVITEYFRVCPIDELMRRTMTMSINEYRKFCRQPVLAYEEIMEDEDGDEHELYTQLSEPFNSRTEAEAARLQFIHDHCELPKDNFDL